MARVSSALTKLSWLLTAVALLAITACFLQDWGHHLQPSSAHLHWASYALIAVGLALGCHQFRAVTTPRQAVEGTMLSLAFVLWGCEQLHASGRLTTLFDEAVVGIFVAQGCALIWSKLKCRSD